jgi:hypothetical protein
MDFMYSIMEEQMEHTIFPMARCLFWRKSKKTLNASTNRTGVDKGTAGNGSILGLLPAQD